ncbi:hypothetical protein HPB50_028040 [Hyalomma asiaticum]|nr:hypothetical protein HPB50_028040 [Hyalomma asiaticum]
MRPTAAERSPQYQRKRCAVKGCNSNSRTPGVSLHRFPLTSTRREYWVKFRRPPCLRGKTPGQLRLRVVCSLHFRESAFLRPGFLRRDAVPTIFPVIGTRSNNHDDACGDRGENHVQPSKTEEQPDNVLVDNTVPALEARDNAAPQAPSVLEPTLIRFPEGSASEREFPRVEVPCTSHRDVRRKTKELKAKLRKQRDLNRRLQARLQRQRQALTLEEVVRSVRSHVSPAVAALVEAQLRMNNAQLAAEGRMAIAYEKDQCPAIPATSLIRGSAGAWTLSGGRNSSRPPQTAP